WPQPRRSHLLRRRWMRRLLFRSFRRMMVFTRNPFVHPVLEKADTPINTGKTEGFRVFHEFLPANARNFACLATSQTQHHVVSPNSLREQQPRVDTTAEQRPRVERRRLPNHVRASEHPLHTRHIHVHARSALDPPRSRRTILPTRLHPPRR